MLAFEDINCMISFMISSDYQLSYLSYFIHTIRPYSGAFLISHLAGGSHTSEGYITLSINREGLIFLCKPWCGLGRMIFQIFMLSRVTFNFYRGWKSRFSLSQQCSQSMS